MARHKSETPYTLTVTNTHGVLLWSFAGSLLRVLDLFAEANTFTAAPIDTYSRIRRELMASGGAYARYYEGYDEALPVLVQVLAAELLPARLDEANELPVGRGAVAAAANADIERRGLISLHPDRLSTFGTSPVVQHEAGLTPTPLDILIEQAATESAPAERKLVAVPLAWGEMTPSQQLEYVTTGKPQLGNKPNQHPTECTCGDCRQPARPPRVPKLAFYSVSFSLGFGAMKQSETVEAPSGKLAEAALITRYPKTKANGWREVVVYGCHKVKK